MVENIAIDARLRLDDSRRVRESVLVRNYEGDTLEQWPPGWHPRVIRHDIVPVTHNCLESLVINCNELPCTEAILWPRKTEILRCSRVLRLLIVWSC